MKKLFICFSLFLCLFIPFGVFADDIDSEVLDNEFNETESGDIDYEYILNSSGSDDIEENLQSEEDVNSNENFDFNYESELDSELPFDSVLPEDFDDEVSEDIDDEVSEEYEYVYEDHSIEDYFDLVILYLDSIFDMPLFFEIFITLLISSIAYIFWKCIKTGIQ